MSRFGANVNSVPVTGPTAFPFAPHPDIQYLPNTDSQHDQSALRHILQQKTQPVLCKFLAL